MAELLKEHDLIPDRALVEGDPDSFRHQAIAGRVAEICRHCPTPANIALFGPWGSGKSSLFELLRRDFSDRSGKIVLVRYDAWKFGGSSLKRNFISHAATDLGLSDEDVLNRDFHRGLYESTKSLDLQFGRFLKGEIGRIIRWSVFTLVVALIVVAAAAAVVGGLGEDQDAWSTITLWIRGWGGPLGGFLAAVVAALALLDIAKVHMEQSAPAADEQFAKTFGKLVREAKYRGNRGRFGRVVFFIDELDRCSKADVVETLTALRTFLDISDCVFIVVADRAVLEEALIKLPQSTPANSDTPYYSTASAFLDKIFQYQIELPPLRVARLTRFARDLVVDRGGLWQDLQVGDEDKLNDVVYALIPSHVASPRRVKVLLNRFATNARIAEARGLNWRARAEEIAKLTVFQTEFPTFADALVVEPRLPDYVLSGEAPHPLPVRSARVIRRYVALDDSSDGAATGEASGEGYGKLIAGPAEEPKIRKKQREQLHRYLERTTRYANPSRDLLYLEAAGASVGLEPQTGQLLEDLARESPDQAVEVVNGLSVEQKTAAVLFVSGMVEREFGIERSNVLDVAFGVTDSQDGISEKVAVPLAKAIHAYRYEQDLSESQLVSALKVSLAGRDRHLTSTLFEDDRLLSSPDRIKAVAMVMDQLGDDAREMVAARVSEVFEDAPQILLEPVNVLPPEVADWLLSEVSTAVVQQISSQELAGETEAAAQLLDEIAASQVAASTIRSLLWQLSNEDSSVGYDFLAKHQELLEDVDPQRVNSHVLRALLLAPPGDFPLWAPHLSVQKRWDEQGVRAVRVLKRLIKDCQSLDGDLLEASIEIAKTAALIAEAAKEEAIGGVREELRSAMQARNWWTKAQEYEAQSKLHLLAGSIAENETTRAEVDRVRAKDVRRAIDAQPRPTAPGLQGVRLLSTGLPPEHLTDLLEALRGVESKISEPLSPEYYRTRLAFESRLHAAGEDVEISPPSKVGIALGDYSEAGLEALGDWLDTGPRVEDAVQVLRDTPAGVSRRVARACTQWAGSLDSPRRTDLLLQLWSRGIKNEAWIRQLKPLGVDEVKLVTELVEQTQKASHASEREELIDRLVALSPDESSAQYLVGDLVVGLLETGFKIDVDLALRAVPALGRGHRSKVRIERALSRATQDLGVKVKPSQARSLRSAGIDPPKRSFTERAWSFFTGNN